ncbi:MAG: aminopeptidase P family protein [Lachnospiraceae bacterium]|nr:aminopeptidase P family protein [Lachnospiraceae bacterium]
MEVRERLAAVRRKMKENGLTAYYVNDSDFHLSEYVGDYFKVREFLSGFTGSNGIILIMSDMAGLWTDGRYFVQAERELEGSGISLFKMGEEGVPTVLEFLEEKLGAGDALGYDGRTVSAAFGKKLKKLSKKKGFKINPGLDLSEGIFDRPPLPSGRAFVLGKELSGETVSEKLEKLRSKLNKEGADALFLSSLDDIMWLFNIRGADIAFNPVALSHAFISVDRAVLFIQEGAVNGELREAMAEAGVDIAPYLETELRLIFYIYETEYLVDIKRKGGKKPKKEHKKIEGKKSGISLGKEKGGRSGKKGRIRILADKEKVSYSLYRTLKKHAKVHFRRNITEEMKAVKNEVEIGHIKKAYFEDSLALTRFIHYFLTDREKPLPANTDQGEGLQGGRKAEGQKPRKKWTEWDISEKLEEYRKGIDGYLGPSFTTISAYGPNAAMMHYEPSKDNPVEIGDEGMLLIDSGGQYMGGTTDVTRTLILGGISAEERHAFTRAACGMLSLLNAKFLKGCTGRNLDILARAGLWNEGMDYKCGTGHGIGYMLNVHEGPQGIRWKQTENEAALEAGMLISDEPGVYRAGKYGIRTENVLLVRDDMKTEDGQFLSFENLTIVPIDHRGMDLEEMSAAEVKQYREYQGAVYEGLSPYLNEDEKEWLKEYAGLKEQSVDR